LRSVGPPDLLIRVHAHKRKVEDLCEKRTNPTYGQPCLALMIAEEKSN
jgi:hypothetical protein